MKYIFIILLATSLINAQQGFHNFGSLQIHDQGEVGFHIDLINDGTFKDNFGIVGFYNEKNSLSISGTEIPKFYNMEVDVKNHLFLEITTKVENSLAYMGGDIVTPRQSPSVSIDFLPNSIYGLDDDLKNTDGYASFSGNSKFIFPIGDDDKLRSLIIPYRNNGAKFNAAYFNETPNSPSTFTNTFDTTVTESIIKNVSVNEFWDFDGASETEVTLTWNQESNIIDLVNNLSNLRVVGWHINDQEWKNLGNTETTGTVNKGTITSKKFKPNDYDIITFGSLVTNESIIVYQLFSPNDDGINDFLTIEGIDSSYNELKVYNRWGHIVYKRINYKNNWDGISEGNLTINKNKKLPVGTYFYTLELPKENKTLSGWIYLNY